MFLKSFKKVPPLLLVAILLASVANVFLIPPKEVNSVGGEVSNSTTFTVSSPVPTITSISPTSVNAGTSEITLTINGTNFITLSVVKWNNIDRTTTYVSPTQLTATIPASDLTTATTRSVTVSNPAPGGGASNSATFTINNLSPLIENITPTSATVGSNQLTLTIAGAGLIPGSQIKWNNSIKTTTYVSATQLTATIPASDLTTSGTYNITITNPSPGGGTSDALIFTVNEAEVVVPPPPPPPIIQGLIKVINNIPFEEVIDNIQKPIEAATQLITEGTKALIEGIKDIIQNSEVLMKGVEVVTESAKVVVEQAKVIVETPEVAVTTQVVSTVGVAAGGAATASAAPLSFPLSEIFLFPVRLWGMLLSLLGIRKKNLPWGVVFDSVTKQPLDPSYVTLKGLKGKDISSSITDLDGRYGFLVPPGTYTIEAKKTNYVFPSKKLTGLRDEVYNNLYFGEKIEIKKLGEVISKNIPLDPVRFDWNEFAKKDKNLMKFYSRFDIVIRKIADPSFIIGFVVSLIALLLLPSIYSVIMFVCYLVLLLIRSIMRVMGVKPKSFGHVYDKEGAPLSFAIMRVIMPSSNTEISSKVVDKYGRYYCLVPKGKYYVKIERKNRDGSYSLAYTSPVIDASKSGIIKERFVV